MGEANKQMPNITCNAEKNGFFLWPWASHRICYALVFAFVKHRAFNTREANKGSKHIFKIFLFNKTYLSILIIHWIFCSSWPLFHAAIYKGRRLRRYWIIHTVLELLLSIFLVKLSHFTAPVFKSNVSVNLSYVWKHKN